MWKTAVILVETVSVRTVISTQPIILEPMNTRTDSGFVRKIRNFDAAVTEPVVDSYSQKNIVMSTDCRAQQCRKNLPFSSENM